MTQSKNEPPEENPPPEPQSEIEAAENASPDPKATGDQLDGGGPGSGV